MNMSGPSWLADFFAVLMLAVTVYSGARLVVSRLESPPTPVETDVVHAVMGLAMAGMFVRGLDPLPGRAWEVVFSGMAAWFSWRCLVNAIGDKTSRPLSHHSHAAAHYPTHGVMAFAMLYMYFDVPAQAKVTDGAVAMTTGASGASSDFLGLPLVFLIWLLVSGVWELDQTERSKAAMATRRVQQASSPAVPAIAIVGGGRPVTVEAGQGVPADVDRPPNGAEVRPNGDDYPASRLMSASHVVMCVAMSYMLVVML